MRPRLLPVSPGILMAAMALAGCGEDPGIEQGTVPFKGTDTSSLDPLRADMTKNMRERPYIKKPDGGGQPAATSERPTGSGPAGQSRPGASPVPLPKGG